MRATTQLHLRRPLARARVVGVLTTAVIATTMLGGTASAADSRDFTVTVGTPTPVSAGGVTKFDVLVDSDDNQTIANVSLTIPAVGTSLPAGVTISGVFGQHANLCSAPTAAGLTCDFGNIAAFGARRVSVLASVDASVLGGTVLTFSASVETNNENGANRQVETGTNSVTAIAFSANGVTTFNLGGLVTTSALGSSGAGNLQTKLNLPDSNNGLGNAIVISESTSSTQPAYCVALKLTCQPDSVDVFVNAGDPVVPHLETILVAKVPANYNVRKAFVIHVRNDGSIDDDFPLFNSTSTSCAAHPGLVPCADFSLNKTTNVLMVTVHTEGNGKFSF